MSCVPRGTVEGKGRGKGRTNVASDIRVETAEDDVAVGKLRGLALAHDEVADGAHGGGLLPFRGVAVLLAGGARGGANGDELEVGQLAEQQNKTLSDGACASKDAWEKRYRSAVIRHAISHEPRPCARNTAEAMVRLTYRTSLLGTRP